MGEKINAGKRNGGTKKTWGEKERLKKRKGQRCAFTEHRLRIVNKQTWFTFVYVCLPAEIQPKFHLPGSFPKKASVSLTKVYLPLSKNRFVYQWFVCVEFVYQEVQM